MRSANFKLQTIEKINTILRLHASGWSYRKIAKHPKVNMHFNNVYLTLKAVKDNYEQVKGFIDEDLRGEVFKK